MTPAGSGRKTPAHAQGGASLRAVLAGVLGLALAAVVLILLSPRFAGGHEQAGGPLGLLVAVLLGAGITYVVAVRALASLPGGLAGTLAIIAFSLALGASQLLAEPLQATDFYRSLLDGGVTACGDDPYLLTPREQERALATVRALGVAAGAGGEVGDAGGAGGGPSSAPPCLADDPRWPLLISRIEQPDRPTDRPPLLQYWLASVVAVAGPSLNGLRVSYLMAELILLIALAALLRARGASPLAIAVFGWAPVVFKEVFNSGHDDIVAAMFVTVAALAWTARRHVLALGLLGLVAGCKPVALLLCPLWLRATPRGRRLAAAAVFAAVLVAPCLPFLHGAGHAAAWARMRVLPGDWLKAAPLYAYGVPWLAAHGLPGTSAHMHTLMAALAAAALGLLACLYPLPAADREASALRGSMLVLVAALLLASVARASVRPWQWCWVLPLFALDPRPAWLVLVAMLPLYYLDFALRAYDMTAYRPLLAMLELLPCALLALGGLAQRNRSSSAGRIKSAARA